MSEPLILEPYFGPHYDANDKVTTLVNGVAFVDVYDAEATLVCLVPAEHLEEVLTLLNRDEQGAPL